ncbi:MAG: hypothetical protein FJ403_02940 [Verrucomicrobia bacterium]|nr:hypothetical protein [Verrucomicrobiota bacterium]
MKEVDAYLQALAKFKDERYPAQTAWDEIGALGGYTPRLNGLHKDLPTFCIKVPAGCGKTLLATQVLGLIYKTILKERVFASRNRVPRSSVAEILVPCFLR